MKRGKHVTRHQNHVTEVHQLQAAHVPLDLRRTPEELLGDALVALAEALEPEPPEAVCSAFTAVLAHCRRLLEENHARWHRDLEAVRAQTAAWEQRRAELESANLDALGGLLARAFSGAQSPEA